MRAVKITARLANELTGDAPQLDALMMKQLCKYQPSAGAHERHDQAPPMDLLPACYLRWTMIGRWRVHHCSAPILGEVCSDRHQRISQHFPREASGLLPVNSRGTIVTTNGPQKSFYLPVRRRLVNLVSWFALVTDNHSNVRKVLRKITHIGQDRARGEGRVAEWSIEDTEADYSWYAPHPQGTVLMRSLPFGNHLPKDLIGYVRDFDAVVPPYWHPERKCEVVKPC